VSALLGLARGDGPAIDRADGNIEWARRGQRGVLVLGFENQTFFIYKSPRFFFL
jgi:hypothetical protein